MGLKQNIKNKLCELIAEISRKADTTQKHSVFCIGTTMNVGNEDYFFSSIREGVSYVCGNIMISNVCDLDEIVGIIDGRVNEILIDIEGKKSSCIKMHDIIRKGIKKSTLGYFRGNAITANAFEYFFTNYCRIKNIDFSGRGACVIGAGHLGAKIAGILVEYGMDVYICDCDEERSQHVVESINTMVARGCNGRLHHIRKEQIIKKNYLVIVGVTNGIPVVTVEMIDKLEEDGFVIDAGLKTVTDKAIHKAGEKNIPIICLLSKPGFNGMMVSRYEFRKIVDVIAKRRLKEGFSLVSGGMIGCYGDVIVDNAGNPERVIGIAKGDGLVLTGKEKEIFNDRISLVRGKYVEEKKE